jgi:Rps23 Pro-64 3,4-dihydroxylase Tpa1-like proline 4-hydroxylase
MIRQESIDLLNQGYTETYPFPHIVIDNFLEEESLKKIVEEVSALDSKDAYYKAVRKPNALEFNKFAFKSNLPPTVDQMFKELVSDSFVDSIEHLTGMKQIIRNDLSLAGAGVHRIHNHGYLAVHTDFNTYTHPSLGKLDRRINILIYLNPEWKDEYKGHLWLCNEKEPIKKIMPILNRCVIFNTTGKSFHGHPERLRLPNDQMHRESIACYYYTKNVNDPLDFEGVQQHSSAWVYPQFPYDF